MSATVSSSRTLPRELAHKEAQKLLRTGDFRKAADLLEKILDAHPPHVGVISDLAACHYFLLDHFRFRKSTERLHLELSIAKEKLSVENKIKTQIRLSNYLEELGQIHSARIVLNQAVAHARSLDDPSLFYRLCAHVLRFNSQFISSKNNDEFYATLIRVKDSEPSFYFSTEVQHALILFEAAHFETSHSMERLEQYLALADTHDLLKEDKELLVFDWIDQVIQHKKHFDPKQMGPRSQVVWDSIKDSHICFESCLKKVILNSNVEFSRWVKELTPASTLRVFCLDLHLNGATSDKLNAWKLYLSELDVESRKAWNRKKGEKESTSSLISYNSNSGEISSGGNHLVLSKRSKIKELLDLMGSGQTNTSTLLDQLYKSPTVSDFDKLRVAIHRFNKQVLETLGVEKVIKLRKDRIEIKIRFQ